MELKNHVTGEVTTEKYDKLVLSPGAAPIRPPLPGIDLPGIFSVRTVPDARNIREWLDRDAAGRSGMNSYTGFQTVMPAKRAVVVGGGFIGLEMVENLVHRGLEVTLIERLNQVMPPLDPEMARLVERYMVKHGVQLELNDGVAGFEQSADGSLEVLTSSGKRLPADIVILAIGVRPETALAKMAGIEIGQRGGIRVDEQMRTSDPDIFAVGDAVEVKDFVTGQWTLIPLAGPANRQGRIAADVICRARLPLPRHAGHLDLPDLRGRDRPDRRQREGPDAAWRQGFREDLPLPEFARRLLSGRQVLAIKVLFRKSDGRLLGAQVLGEDGVPKRIDSFAMAIQAGFTIYDLEEAELCYAPPFGSAKDPVNFAGMVAANILRGDMPLMPLGRGGRRVPPRCAQSSGTGRRDPCRARSTSRCRNCARASANSPATARSSSFCRSGQRAYYATRILLQNGFKARNISGGMLSRSHRAGN